VDEIYTEQTGGTEMTIYEQLADAFPLHFQRICEYGYQHNGVFWQPPQWDKYRAERDAGRALLGVMIFDQTSEGEDYWWQLALPHLRD